MIRTILLIILTLFIAMTSPAQAHDLWVQQTDTEPLVVTGHDGKAKPSEPATVKEVKVFDETGKLKKSASSFKDKAAFAIEKNGIAAITVFQDEGFLSVTPDGMKPLPKRLVKDAYVTNYFHYYTKTLVSWSEAMARPLGMKLEIVPLTNPLTLKSGDTLPIQVYYEGKLLAEAKVEDGASDGTRKTTDSNGLASVTVGHPGRQFVTAYWTTPYDKPEDADKFALISNLTYLVP